MAAPAGVWLVNWEEGATPGPYEDVYLRSLAVLVRTATDTAAGTDVATRGTQTFGRFGAAAPVTFTDNFDRADGPLGGSWSTPHPIFGTGTWTVDTDKAKFTSASGVAGSAVVVPSVVRDGTWAVDLDASTGTETAAVATLLGRCDDTADWTSSPLNALAATVNFTPGVSYDLQIFSPLDSVADAGLAYAATNVAPILTGTLTLTLTGTTVTATFGTLSVTGSLSAPDAALLGTTAGLDATHQAGTLRCVRFDNFTFTGPGPPDVAGGTDTATRGAQAYARTTADTATGVDTAGRAFLTSRAGTDLGTAADMAARGTQTAARAGNDTSGGTETAGRTALGFVRTTADTATGSDSTGRALLLARAVSDPAVGTDSAARAAQTVPRTSADGAGGTDTATRGATNIVRTGSDSAGGTDTASRTTVVYSRVGADTAAGADSPSRAVLLLSRTVGDTAAISDSAVRAPWAFIRATGDAAGGADTSIGLLVHTALRVVLAVGRPFTVAAQTRPAVPRVLTS